MTSTTISGTLGSPRPAPWDEVSGPPGTPGRARIAERLFRLAVRDLPVRVSLPGGHWLGAGGPDAPVMHVHDPHAFFRRLGGDAKIGFGESYMAGDWDSPQLAGLLTPFAARMASLIPRPLQVFRRWVDDRHPADERNSTRGSRRNIQRHYDLSNEVFARFLDETMTYSAACFTLGTESLEQAQHAKIDAVLDLAGVRAGTRLLEIGTGWGSLAVRAAQRGAQVTTLTISREQWELANERVAAAGVADRVDIQLKDYRDAEGRYDAVVSVEMVEAVGDEYWPVYFARLDELLVPGGRVGLQAITMPHDRLVATRGSYTWIHKYIFPGGQLLSIPSIEQQLARHTTLHVSERHSLGDSYALTLAQWQQRFQQAWPHIGQWGFSEGFRRMWEFYLAYAEAGFRSGYLDTWQLGLTKPG